MGVNCIGLRVEIDSRRRRASWPAQNWLFTRRVARISFLEIFALKNISILLALHSQHVEIIFNHMVKCSSRVLDRTFGALADPTRRHILEHLSGGDRCVTDLARPYRMSLPAVSKHLRILEKAGLVRRRRDGRVHRLKLEAKPMQQAQMWIEEYRKFWEASFDRLDEYLKQLQKEQTK
jgi:DNA-binding transcriptional ArsR family regulator